MKTRSLLQFAIRRPGGRLDSRGSFLWRPPIGTSPDVDTREMTLSLYANETISIHWNSEGIGQRFGEAAVVP